MVHSLIDNAVRYTPAGGTVALRATAGADGIRLTVEDSGPGIAAEELPRVKNGLGLALISTSKGIMSDKKARSEHVGGEVLCTVF